MKRKISSPNKENEEISTKRLKLDIVQFREELKSSNYIPALKNFIQLCDSPEEDAQLMVKEYLNAGGSAFELVNALDKDVKNIALAAHVFSSVNIVVMTTLLNAPEYKDPTEKACRDLLNKYIRPLNNVLNNVGARQIKSVLNLLTGMIKLNPTLSNEILNIVNFNPRIMQTLIKHTQGYSTSTRKSFLIFLITLLSCGVDTALKLLIDSKVYIVNNIFHGLIYDDPNIITLLFKALTTHILENKNIAKTKKMYIFKWNVVRSLFNLYSWKGPKNWKKNNKDNIVFEPSEVNQEELDIVVENLNEFLLKLCTSPKFGIIFQDNNLGQSNVKCNSLLLSSLQDIHELCNNTNCRKILIKIIGESPDLIKPIFLNLKTNLEPINSVSWFNLMDLIKETLMNQNFEKTLRIYLPNLSIKVSVNAIQWLTSPTILLKSIEEDMLTHEELIIQLEGLNILHLCLNRVEYLFSLFDLWKEFQSDYKNEVKEKIISNLTTNLPKGTILQKTWKSLLNNGQQESILNVLNNMSKIFLFYQRHCSHILDIIDFNPLNLLVDLENLDSTDSEALFYTIELNIIELIICRDIKHILHDQITLQKTISLLFKIFALNDLKLIKNAYNVMFNLFKSSNIFLGCESEIYLWTLAFKLLSTNDKDLGIEIMTNALKSSNLSQINISTQENSDFSITETAESLENILTGLLEEENNESNEWDILNNINLSPMIISVLEHIKKKENFNSTKIFTTYIGILLLHRQKTPQNLISIFNLHPQILSSKFLKYLNNCDKTNPLLLPLEVEFNLENEIINYFYYSKDIDLAINLNINQNPFEAVRCLSIFQMTLFYLIQFARVDKLDESILNKIESSFIAMLDKLIPYCSEENNYQLIFECLQLFYKHPFIYDNFSPFKFETSTNELITKVFITLTEYLKKEKIISLTLQNYMKPYQNILIKNLRKELTKKKNYTEQSLKVINLFHFDIEQIEGTLELLIDSNNDILFIKEQNINFSFWADVLFYFFNLLNDYNEKNSKPLTDALIKKMIKHYQQLKNLNLNMDRFEKLLLKYFEIFSHQLANISKGLFNILINSKNCEENSRQLGHFLVKRDKNLAKVLNKLPINHVCFKKYDFILELLEQDFIENLSLVDKFINNLGKFLLPEIENILINPKTTPNWFKKHNLILSKIIQMTKDDKYSSEIINHLDKNIEFMDHSHFVILQNILLNNSNKNDIISFIKIIIDYTINSKNIDKILEYDDLISEVLKNLQSVNRLQDIFIKINWKKLIKIILKNSFKIVPNNNKYRNPICFLEEICRFVILNKEAKILFEILCSHSEFLNIVLSDSPLKKDIMKLILTVIKKNKTILFHKHVPIYLGAYGASLTETDQIILQILRFYETNNVNFTNFMPFLWGEHAAIYYSIRSQVTQNLDKQITMAQVVNLLNKKKIENTIKNYPLNRDLQEAINENTLKDVYDPNFILPLFSCLLAPEALVQTYKFIHTGALALTLAFMSSDSPSTRSASYLVFARYYYHLENSKDSQRKTLFIHFLEAIRLGIQNISEDIQNQNDFLSNNPQMPSLVTIFLSRMSLIIIEPLHPLYPSLCNFLRAKQSINLNTIPELFNLIHSSNVNFRMEQQWILEIIRDGIRNSKDIIICFNMMLFKLLNGYYSSKLIDRNIKVLILEIYEKACKISSGLPILINNYGLISWIHEIVNNITKKDSKEIQLIINIISSLKKFTKDSKLNPYINSSILQILITLLSKIDSSINHVSLNLFVNTLSETMILTTRNLITIDDIKLLLRTCEKNVPQYNILENKFKYGVEFSKKEFDPHSLQDSLELFLNKYLDM